MDKEHSEMIERLYLEMYDMLLCYARSSLAEEALAEEAVQETFRIACQKPEESCGSPNPKGWLVKTLKYTICDIKRDRESNRQILSDYLATQSRQALFSEDKISLEVMYENIADLEEFRLIKEMAVDGRSHLEMAEARGITVNTCKKRVQRAKGLLRRKIKK